MTHPLENDYGGDANVRRGVPSGDWSRQELSDRAVLENQQITDREKDASHYWLLGKALLFIGADLDYGPWKQWCREAGIERTRWYRATLLARAFGSPDELAGLSIRGATALARELLGIETRQTPLEARHQRRLRTTVARLQKSLDDLKGPTAAQLRSGDKLLLAVDQAAHLLRDLRHAYAAAQRAQHSISPRAAVPA